MYSGGIMKKTTLSIMLIRISLAVAIPLVLAYSQIDQLVDQVAGKNEYVLQQEVLQKARGDVSTLRRFVADSLRLIYSEILEQKLDSLDTVWSEKYGDLQNEKERLAQLNQRLNDSLKVLTADILNNQTIGDQYDADLENKVFQYVKLLKTETNKRPRGLLSFKGSKEDITAFQIEELQNYYDRFYPFARSDSVLDFIAQLWIRNGNWAQAERAIIKFLYLYPNSSLYEEVKSIRASIFQTEKYFRTYASFLNDFLKNVPNYPKPEMRYFRYIELLKDFPDPNLRDFFIPEARQYLTLYPRATQAATVSLWVAEAYLNKGQPHAAYLYYLRTMVFYPEPEPYRRALFACGKIQQEKFEEYENAVYTFNEYFNRFAADTALARDALYRIATIYDVNLRNWQQAQAQYQLYADRYSKSDLAIKALMRKAIIQQTQLGQIDSAVATYKMVEARYPGNPTAIDALIAAGDLLVNKLLFESAIETYQSIFRKYPQSEKAPLALEKVMEIYTSKIKDNDKALETANLIIANYPDSKSAAKANKLVKKLEKVK